MSIINKSNLKKIIQRDLRVIWHPCTQMKDHEKIPLIPIKKGKGVWLEDYDGKKYIDAISSWWVNLFGHSNSYINSKIIISYFEKYSYFSIPDIFKRKVT